MRAFFTSLFVGGCILLVGAGCAASPLALTPNEEVPSSDESSESSSPSMAQQWTYQGTLPSERITGKVARISTEYGDIVFELLPDVAPITVSNFVYLAEGGYYNGLTFHRREEGFVIQGGDPLGNGTGGPGYTIPAEFNDVSHDRGVVAMARSQRPDSAGSQFYITLDAAPFLDRNYTVFGRVVSGMDVVDRIQVGDVMTSVTIEADAQ